MDNSCPENKFLNESVKTIYNHYSEKAQQKRIKILWVFFLLKNNLQKSNGGAHKMLTKFLTRYFDLRSGS